MYYIFGDNEGRASWTRAPQPLIQTIQLEELPENPYTNGEETYLKVDMTTGTVWWEVETYDALKSDIRKKRDELLFETDVLYCNAANWDIMSITEKTAWQQYKQDLRDVTEQEGFPLNVIWPELPDKEVEDNA